MTEDEYLIMDCNEPCDPPCPGKVRYKREVVPALSRMETFEGTKTVYLKCNNPKEQHENPYEVPG